MFAKAKTVARPQPTTAAKSKAVKKTETIDGLEEVCALEACMKALKGILDIKKTALKTAATARLIDLGTARKSKPDSLSLAAGEFATGRVSISKRSTSSPLTQEELDLLAEAAPAERDDEGAITAVPGLVETIETQPAMLAVNPAYAGDETLLKRIDKALAGVRGIPEDFIIQIPAETKAVVSDSATNDLFRLPPELVPQIFEMLAGVSMSAVFKDISVAWELVRPMIAPSPAEAKSRLGEMLAASVEAA